MQSQCDGSWAWLEHYQKWSTADLAKFNLMQLLLKGEALWLFIKERWKLENQTMHIMRNASVQYLDTFFPKNALRTPSATCERSICTMRWPSASMWCISINETTILPYSPIWQSSTKDQWWWHYRTDPQQPTKSVLKVTLRVQRKFMYGRPRKLPVTIITNFFHKMVTKVCEGNHQDLHRNSQKVQPQGYQ